MTQKVKIGKNSLEFWLEPATVLGAPSRRDELVNSASAATPARAMRDSQEVWVRLDRGGQDTAVQLAPHELPVQAGHRLSICRAAVAGGYPGQMVGVANHTTGESLPVIPADMPGWVHDMSALYFLLIRGVGYVILCAVAFWLIMSRAAALHSESLGWTGLVASGLCMFLAVREFRRIPARMDLEAAKFEMVTRQMLETAENNSQFAAQPARG